jgi:hypothetical protein
LRSSKLLSRLLPFDIDKWEGGQAYFEGNCYNYALDIADSKYNGGAFIPKLRPGELAMRRKYWPDRKRIRKHIRKLTNPESLVQKMFDPKRVEHYIETRIKGAIADGLQFLGEEASFPDNGYPLALFFRGMGKTSHSWFRTMDYHWYSMRQDDVGNRYWACKFLNGGVKVLDGQSVFTDALHRGYEHFAGYFSRPYDLDY